MAKKWTRPMPGGRVHRDVVFPYSFMRVGVGNKLQILFRFSNIPIIDRGILLNGRGLSLALKLGHYILYTIVPTRKEVIRRRLLYFLVTQACGGPSPTHKILAYYSDR